MGIFVPFAVPVELDTNKFISPFSLAAAFLSLGR